MLAVTSGRDGKIYITKLWFGDDTKLCGNYDNVSYSYTINGSTKKVRDGLWRNKTLFSQLKGRFW